jgi:hypothetical protein
MGSLILRFSLLFLWFCRFSCHLLVLRIQNSNFMFFVVNVLIKGEIEKPNGRYIGLIVMSH